MSRIDEIRARMSAALDDQQGDWFQACDFWFDEPSARFYGMAPNDIQWLIDEVMRLRRKRSGYRMDVRHIPHDGRTGV